MHQYFVCIMSKKSRRAIEEEFSRELTAARADSSLR
jgi:hypothetical protein